MTGAEPRRVNPGRLELMIPHAVVHMLSMGKTTTARGESTAYVLGANLRGRRYVAIRRSSTGTDRSSRAYQIPWAPRQELEAWDDADGCACARAVSLALPWELPLPPRRVSASLLLLRAMASASPSSSECRIFGLSSRLYLSLKHIPVHAGCNESPETPIALTVVPSPVDRGLRRLGHAEKAQRT